MPLISGISSLLRTGGVALAVIVMLLAAGMPAQEMRLVPFPKSCEPGERPLASERRMPHRCGRRIAAAAGECGQRGDDAVCSARSAAWLATAAKLERLRSRSTSNSPAKPTSLK